MNIPDKREAVVEWAKKEAHRWPIWVTLATFIGHESGSSHRISRLLDDLNRSYYDNPVLTAALVYGTCTAIPKIMRASKEALKKIWETRLATKNIFVLRKNNKGAKRLKQLCEDDLRGPFQLDLFPEEEEEWMEEMRKKWIKHEDRISEKDTRGGQQGFRFDNKNMGLDCQNEVMKGAEKEKIVPCLRLNQISRSSNGEGNAVILQSDYNLPKSPRLGGVTRYKKGLMRMFGLKGMRVFVIASATRADLLRAIYNRNIHHIVVDGHGDWGSWVDSEGVTVKNEDFGYLTYKKRTFVRHTCGHPAENSRYEDQLGTPVADYVFGNSKIQTNLDHIFNPLLLSSPEAFSDSKAKKAEDNRTAFGKLRAAAETIVNSFLEDIGIKNR